MAHFEEGQGHLLLFLHDEHQFSRLPDGTLLEDGRLAGGRRTGGEGEGGYDEGEAYPIFEVHRAYIALSIMLIYNRTKITKVAQISSVEYC